MTVARIHGFASAAACACAVVLLAACAVPAARAQTGAVAGTVRDATGASLPGVNVVVVGTQRGAATDEAGRFHLDGVPAGRRTLAASAVGFERATRVVDVPAGGQAEAHFVLREVTVRSGEVVVTAARRAQLAGRVPMSVSTLTPRDLETRGVVRLDEALQYVSGVHLMENQVNVRGSSGFSYNAGSRVLLLVDGVPMLRPDFEGVAFDAVPPTQIARIEVVKGPGSALYGSGALGGVINVITKDYPAAPETAVRLYGGAYEPVRHDAWREGWKGAAAPRWLGGVAVSHAQRFGDRLGAWVHASYREDRGHLRDDEGRTLQTFAKLGWRPAGAVRAAVLAGVTRRRADTFLYWNGIRDVLNPGALSFAGTSTAGSEDNVTTEISALPTVTHVVAPDLFYAVRGRLYGVLVQPLDDAGRPKAVETAGFRYGGEVQLNWAPAPRRTLTLGLTADANATRSSFFAGADEIRSQPEGAVFAQWEQPVGRRLDVAAGARLDAYRIREGTIEHALSPKLSAAYAAMDGLTLRAAYGAGFRVPSVTERYVEDRNYFPVVSNVDLRPEVSTSYEVGARGALPLRGDRWGLGFDLAVFWNDYRRLVEPTFIPAQQAFRFVNLTRARIRGLEAALDAATTGERLTAALGYTYLDARDRTADLPLVFRPRHLLKAALAARIAGPLEAGVDYRFASRPARIDSDFARFIPDADHLVDVRVLDARLGVRWPRLNAHLIAKNALDYYYAERPALLAPPRHYVLQLQVVF